MKKPELRKILLEKREALDANTIAVNSEALSQHCLALEPYISATSVACYFAFRNEIVLTNLIRHALSQKKRMFMPVVIDGGMSFAPYDETKKCKENRYGILEPEYQQNMLVNAQSIDCIFMPLVGFDRKGDRLGMGAGFYDKALAHINHESTTLVGVAHSIQEMKGFEEDPWDIPLDYVVTEQAVIALGKT